MKGMKVTQAYWSGKLWIVRFNVDGVVQESVSRTSLKKAVKLANRMRGWS